MDTKRYYNYGSILIGIVLIVLGLIFLATTQGYFNFDWGTIWPAFVVLGGVIPLLNLPNAHTPAQRGGLVIGATIPILLGVYFFGAVNNWIGWEMWPVYPLIVGIAFFAGYLASGFQEVGFIIPGVILTAVGLVFGAFVLSNQYDLLGKIWPLFLILAGVLALIIPATRRNSEQ